MLQRYLPLKPACEILMTDQKYVSWIGNQKPDVREKADEVRAIINDGEHWEDVKIALKVLEPALKVLRETDAKKGKSLGYVYHGLLKLDKLYSEPIEGLDEEVREKIHGIFYERWNHFDKPIFAAAYLVDPEYWNYDHDPLLDDKLQAVFDQMAETPGCQFTGAAMWDQYGTVRTLVQLEEERFTKERAFAKSATSKPKWEWCRDYLHKYPALQWAAMRLNSLDTSASACEHSWSIEGWIHSKKRNRLGQRNVERLVRTHTNLRLQVAMKDYKAISKAWDIETIIEEPGETPVEEVEDEPPTTE